MNLDSIPILMETFSKQHGYEYDDCPLPYIPFGGIRGIYQDCKVNMYICRTESNLGIRHHTVFGLSDEKIFPEGFCIEYSGSPNNGNRTFQQLISILSPDPSIVTNYLDDEIETQLLESFLEIDEIDESLFKVRSNLRLCKDGLTLSVWKVYENIDQLNVAFTKVARILVELKKKLSSNM